MNTVTPKESGHWYSPDGQPCHFTVGKNGKSRPTTLRDARERGLFYSVTAITKFWPADNLRNWLRAQDILAAATTPRNGETDDEWVAKVMESADETAELARTVGQRRHELLHRFHRDSYIDATSDDYPFLEPYLAWCREHVAGVVNSEFVVVNTQHGYAGTVDMFCEMKAGYVAIIDVKNRKKPRTYAQDALQLAAYQRCFADPFPQTISIVLGTDKPEIHVEQWLGTDVAWQRFLLCLELCKQSKDYDPVKLTALPF